MWVPTPEPLTGVGVAPYHNPTYTQSSRRGRVHPWPRWVWRSQSAGRHADRRWVGPRFEPPHRKSNLVPGSPERFLGTDTDQEGGTNTLKLFGSGEKGETLSVSPTSFEPHWGPGASTAATITCSSGHSRAMYAM